MANNIQIGRVQPQPAPFTREEVEVVLDRIRPGLASHGGGIDFVCIEGCNVRVTLRGACVGCPSSALTLRIGIERTLREELAGFGDLIADEPAVRTGPSWWRRFVDCDL